MTSARNKPRAAAGRLNVWESALRDAVLSRRRTWDPKPFARFNFLVVAGRIFFIDTAGWWHTVPGDARKVARSLRASRIPVTSVAIVRSDAKWTPYFGRKRDEERGHGWNDPTIVLRATRPADEAAVQGALLAHRAIHERKDNVRF